MNGSGNAQALPKPVPAANGLRNSLRRFVPAAETEFRPPPNRFAAPPPSSRRSAARLARISHSNMQP
ncbi:hypothetical protein ACH79_19025 [Bradyrhizobium sp. CCBAU 051011]|nr:hypothetical protein ACH79_19025 [Bradyrhizobium sp. CCBAU 051011]